MVKRGLMSQASPNELREFLSSLSSSFSLFHGFHTFIWKRTASKNTQKKSNTHSQLERQHNTQKGLLLPSFLPGGDTQQTFIREGSAPRFNLWYLFIYHFSRKSYPFCIPSIDKWYPFHMNILCLGLCIPFNCRKCTFFKIGINISQNRKFSRLYKAMKFIC